MRANSTCLDVTPEEALQQTTDAYARATRRTARAMADMRAAQQALWASRKGVPHDCHQSEVIVGTVFTIYRCPFCGDEEWL
jgi:hypothetical protein